MGAAEEWQARISEGLADVEGTLFNPRREEWDSSWRQSMDEPRFVEQVHWELDNIELSDIVVVNFDPATMSPITLMELGLIAGRKEVIVCCPEGFWRKGNVDMLCVRHGISLYREFADLERGVRSRLRKMAER